MDRVDLERLVHQTLDVDGTFVNLSDYSDEELAELLEQYDYDAEPAEDYDMFRDDVEADADTLRMAGFGTDEDYGLFEDDQQW